MEQTYRKNRQKRNIGENHLLVKGAHGVDAQRWSADAKLQAAVQVKSHIESDRWATSFRSVFARW